MTYNREGDMDNFEIKATVESNGDELKSSVARIPLSNGYRHAIEVTPFSGKKYSSAVESEMTSESIRTQVD